MATVPTIKGIIWGASGVGKTTLLHTLPAEETFVFDLEAGLLAAEGLNLHTRSIRTWQDAKNLACFIGGPNPDNPSGDYSANHYQWVLDNLKLKPDMMNNFKTIFGDSITVASRLAYKWALRQPECTTKAGELNMLKVYGLLGQEIITWATHLQHAKKNVWLVGILDEKKDDTQQSYFDPQMDGGKAALALRGIVDEVITMAIIKGSDKEGKAIKQRAFVCDPMNPWGYPAKDRSGRLKMVEPPHLGNLMEKIREGDRMPLSFALNDEIMF
jgi:hypothetical protein